MKIRNVENGKTIEVPELLGRHLIATRAFVADETAPDKPVEPKKRNPRYRRRDMRAQK